MGVLLTLLIPFISAILILLAGKNTSQKLAVMSTAASVVVTGILTAMYFKDGAVIAGVDWPWVSSMGIRFHLEADGVSLLLLLISNVVALISIYVSLGDNYKNVHQYYALILLMQAFMNGVFVAQDLILYYIFWELVLIPAYFLLLGWGRHDKIRSVTLKFFLYTFLGSLLMLVGIIWLGSYNGTPDFSLNAIYGLSLTTNTQIAVFAAFMIAYAIKTPFFPFHSWIADTYTAAPAPVTILFSGVMSKMALYSIFRFVLPVVPDAIATYGPFVMQLAAFSVLYASLMALAQKDIKRMFAYVSMAHMGLIVAALMINNIEGVHGALMFMAVHAIVTSGLFFTAQILFRMKGTHDIYSFGGIRQYMPVFAGLYMVVLFASIGLPLTNGFIGEFMILTALLKANTLAMVLASISIVIGAVYMLLTYRKVMLGQDNSSGNFSDLQHNDKFLFLSIAFVIIFMGIYSTWITQLCDNTVLNIFQP